MTIYNHTHIQWQQIMTDPSFFGPDKYGVIIDDAFVVQHTHGPFSLEDAPTSYEGEGVVGKSIDHWNGLDHPKLGIRLPEGTKWKDTINVRGERSMAYHSVEQNTC